VPDTSPENAPPRYGERVSWQPETPRIGLLRFLLAWVVAAAAVEVSVWITPGTSLEGTGTAFLVAALLAVLNALLPPVLAALRLPLMLVTGFLIVLPPTPRCSCSPATSWATTSTWAASATRCSRRC